MEFFGVFFCSRQRGLAFARTWIEEDGKIPSKCPHFVHLIDVHFDKIKGIYSNYFLQIKIFRFYQNAAVYFGGEGEVHLD